MHDVCLLAGAGTEGQMITVVSLGGDDEGCDHQAVDIVVRRAERWPVSLAKPPEEGESDQEAH